MNWSGQNIERTGVGGKILKNNELCTAVRGSTGTLRRRCATADTTRSIVTFWDDRQARNGIRISFQEKGLGAGDYLLLDRFGAVDFFGRSRVR